MVACRGESFAVARLLEDIFRGILAKFFPDTVKSDMEQKFINLRLVGKIVDVYAVDLLHIWCLLRRIGLEDFSSGCNCNFSDMFYHSNTGLLQKC